MAITLTGNKYTGTITTTGTTTLTDSSASFSSADFGSSVPRMAWLFRSGSPVGFCRVNSFTSSTSLQLDQLFVDIDGEEVTQIVGDTYYISLLFSELVTTGLSVSGGQVTCTDRIDFGTSGNKASLILHSENEIITTDEVGSNAQAPFQFFGGCSTFGNPLNLKERITASSSTFYASTTASGHGLCVKSTDATQMHFGSTFIFENGNTGRMPGGNGAAGFTPAYWQVFVNCNMNGNFVTPGGGALWSSRAEFQRLINTNSSGSGVDLINSRWADGFFEGGSFQNSGSGLAPFGADAAGTFNVAATPGKRISVFDCARNAIWRSVLNPVQTINFTNILVRDVFKNSIGDNKTFNFIFSEVYTGLLGGTKLYIKDTNGSLVDSQTLPASGVSDPVNITYQTRQTTPLSDEFFNPWEIGFCDYDSQIISFQIDTGTNKVAGQDVVDIFFGGPLVQSKDTLITESTKATVAAYTEINTGERLYDRAKLYLVENYAGQTETLITRSGNVYDLRTLNLVIDATAAADFAFDGTTITIKATTFTGNITTTGTVSRLNGATVDGVVSDANGVEVLIQTNTSEFGFYGEVDGVPLGAYVSGLTQKKVQITTGQTLKFFVGSHGYKSKYLEITTANTEDGFVILDRESAIDITVPQATKDSVVAGLASTLEAGPQLAIEVSQDFKDFTPTEFLSGFDYFIYTNSQNIAPLIVAAGSTDLYTFSDGTVTNLTPNFYVRLSNNITTQIDRGYYIPMVVVDGAPGVVSVRANTSGLLLGTALWTKASANITTLDVLRIQDPLAKEVTLNTKASQTSVDAVKTKTDNLPADPAGVSDLANVSTSAELAVVNEGVKKASLGIPHNGDI